MPTKTIYFTELFQRKPYIFMYLILYIVTMVNGCILYNTHHDNIPIIYIFIYMRHTFSEVFD